MSVMSRKMLLAGAFGNIVGSSPGSLLGNKLTASDGAANDWFGYSVSISSDGTTALIGSSYDDDKGADSGSAYVFKYNGTSWAQQAKLTASDGAANDLLGRAVSISSDGTTALIGASYDDDKGADSGSAYVFKYNGTAWTQQAKLTASDGAATDYFGFSISLSSDGTTALIGAINDDDKGSNSGSAYVFKYNGTSWTQQSKLTASDGAANDGFGYSVSISLDGTTALIGAYLDDGIGANSGSAYIFKYNGTSWSQQAKLTASDGAADDYFGSSVSISADGTTALIGAINDDDKGTNSGSAYVFKYNGTVWSQQAKLTASDGAANDLLGRAVSISSDGTTALIGSYADDDKGTDSGSAYVFKYNGTSWAQQAKLTASDGATNDRFGFSVSISSDGTTALIGSYADDDKGIDSGSAYVFAV